MIRQRVRRGNGWQGWQGGIGFARIVVPAEVAARCTRCTPLELHGAEYTIHCMELTFVQLPGFVKEWKQLRLGDDDLRALELMLLENPQAGAVMAGTGGMRKVRFAPPSRRSGKSGAYRVGYAFLRLAETVLLVAIFAKSDKGNLTAAEKLKVKRAVGAFRRD